MDDRSSIPVRGSHGIYFPRYRLQIGSVVLEDSYPGEKAAGARN